MHAAAIDGVDDVAHSGWPRDHSSVHQLLTSFDLAYGATAGVLRCRGGVETIGNIGCVWFLFCSNQPLKCILYRALNRGNRFGVFIATVRLFRSETLPSASYCDVHKSIVNGVVLVSSDTQSSKVA